MKGSVRYIITRPCLSEGSLRLLKYLQPTFPNDGPITLRDERGHDYSARVSHAEGRVWDLGELYSNHNLGVNDVLMISSLEAGRYQVECVVKPAERPGSPARNGLTPRPPEPRRVVVGESPYVREVRLERRAAPSAASPVNARPTPETPEPGNGAAPAAPDVSAAAPAPNPVQVERRRTTAPGSGRATPAAPMPTAQGATADGLVPSPAPRQAASLPTRTAQTPSTQAPSIQALAPQPPSTQAQPAQAQPIQPQPGQPQPSPEPVSVGRAPVAAPPAPAQPETPLALLEELAQRCGYRFERLPGEVVRLRADLGQHGYSVLVALSENALQAPAWNEPCDYMALLTSESQRPQGVPRLTVEALSALLDHARLAALTPIELRGYWNTGSFDSESVASVAELVSAHLSQRGTFSFVLMTLAQQPAHSVVSVPRLAERLGSGVNAAELRSVLETLSRPPFLALSPLSSGQYYLREGVAELLDGLSEYAESVRKRVVVGERERALSR